MSGGRGEEGARWAWLREPLLHFALAGALLFAAHAWLRGDDDPGGGPVRITAAEVEWLRTTWARQWGRSPTPDELREVVAGHLREELLAREARALGLDENDMIVRRRLAQKMEFLVTDVVQAAEPDDEELRRLYDAHPERFRSPARASFTHLYFDRERRGDRAERDAREALARLARTEDAAASGLGDRFLSQTDFADADEEAVTSVLGPDFARALFALEAGAWEGPIESGYGLHLVRVRSREPARRLDFGAVRDEVRALWRQRREREGRERYFEALLERYEVAVDPEVRDLVGPLAVAGSPE